MTHIIRAMPSDTDSLSYQVNLRAWRKFRKLTLEQVEELIEKDNSTIGRWEKGETPITSADLIKLCRIYKVTPQELLSPPKSALLAKRSADIMPLIEKMDDEAFDHLMYIAKKTA